jgi:arylsulfatase A-like enzyme
MKKQPNILFLFADQQRLDTLGCYGNAVCRTPQIDRLAAEGVRFTQAYTPTSICTPARGSILTGLMPHRHRLLANFERNVGYLTELPDDLVPYSAYLRQAGYNTGSFGKWHVGQERGPEEYAFDGPHFPGWAPPIQHPEYQAYLQEKGLPPFEVRDLVRGRFPNGQPANVIAGLYDGPPEGLFDAFITERAIRQMRAYAAEDKPFFLACHWFGPHLPYFLPPEVFSRYAPQDIPLPPTMADTLEGKPQVQRHYAAHWAFDSFTPDDWRRIIAAYWGYVSLLDEQVGRLLAALRQLGLADDTVIVYGSDHGAFAGSHRMQDKGPAMYDDTYHVPLIMRLPGGRSADEERFVNLVDLPATFLDLAGVPVPEHFDGRSLVPLLRGEDPPDWRDHVIAEFHGHHFPYPQRMIRTATHKLVVNPPDIDELYDLVDDPLEMVNRIDDPAYADVRRELYGRLYDDLRAAGDNFYHWMTSMYPVGAAAGDASLSQYKV